MAYYQGGETSVTAGEGADYATVYRVTPQFFTVLGVRSRIGRLPSSEEFQTGGPLVAVITDAYWARQFNRSPAVIGTPIKFADRIFTITGVLPAGQRFPARADIYCPAWWWPETTSRG